MASFDAHQLSWGAQWTRGRHLIRGFKSHGLFDRVNEWTGIFWAICQLWSRLQGALPAPTRRPVSSRQGARKTMEFRARPATFFAWDGLKLRLPTAFKTNLFLFSAMRVVRRSQ
jgi:hypothetical protein